MKEANNFITIPRWEAKNVQYTHTCGTCGHSYKDEYEKPVPCCLWCGKAWKEKEHERV